MKKGQVECRIFTSKELNCQGDKTKPSEGMIATMVVVTQLKIKDSVRIVLTTIFFFREG